MAAPAPAPGREPPSGRLVWRCRRGMKELDVLLERFVRVCLPGAPAEERESFEALLGLPDPVLAQYLLGGGTPAEPHWARLVRRIRNPADYALF